jgi:hypothetical protein
MPETTPQVDKERLKASMSRLYEIYRDIAETANEVSRWRCPYKDAQDRCTAQFKCRNQFFTGTPGEPAICTGSDKLNYRAAWEI